MSLLTIFSALGLFISIIFFFIYFFSMQWSLMFVCIIGIILNAGLLSVLSDISKISSRLKQLEDELNKLKEQNEKEQ